jgi:antitoxin MazE
MTTTTIQKWGNSYAVRLPKDSMRRMNLRAGQAVRIEEGPNETLAVVPVRESTLALATLVGRITSGNRHAEVDWGVAVGQEVW